MLAKIRGLTQIRRRFAAILGVLLIFAGLFFSLTKPVAASTPGTSTVATATASAAQRKVVVTSSGTIAAFYNAGTQSPSGIAYSTSADGGSTWSAATQVDSTNTNSFSVAIDSSNNMYVAFSNGASVFTRKLTYGAGSWSVGSAVTALAGTACTAGCQLNPTIAIQSSNVIVVSATINNSSNPTTSFNSARSTNGGTSYGSIYNAPGSIFGNSLGVYAVTVAVGADMWLIGPTNQSTICGVAKDIGATGTWTNTGTTLTSCNTIAYSVTSSGSNSLDLFYTDNSLHLNYVQYSISGNSFGSITTISSAAGDVIGAISAGPGGKMRALYQEFQATNSYKVAYKTFDGVSTWSGPAYVSGSDSSDNTNINSSVTGGGSSGGIVGAIWTSGTASPWTVNGSNASFNSSPGAPTLSSPADGGSVVSTTPTLQFSSTDPDSDDVRYETQVDTGNTFASTIDSYSETNQNSFYSVGPNDTSAAAQAFKGNGSKLASVTLYLQRQGTPTGNYSFASIYASSGTYGTSAIPTGAALAHSDNIDISTISDQSFVLVTLTFSGANQITLNSGTVYELVLDDSGMSVVGGSDAIDTGIDTTSPTHPGNAADGPVVWSPHSTIDMVFYINSTPLLDKVSGTDAGYTDVTNASDTDPFASGDSVSYTVPSGSLTRGTTYYWRTRAIDPNGTNAYSSWSATRSFTVNAVPATPTLASPSSSQTVLTTSPVFALRSSDADNDNLQYGLKVYTTQTECDADSATNLVRSIDQPGDQTGWMQQNAASNSAYTSSSSASNSSLALYAYQDPQLTVNTTFWWKARAYDPSGSQTYSSWSTCQSFTTASQEVQLRGGTTIRGGTTVQ